MHWLFGWPFVAWNFWRFWGMRALGTPMFQFAMNALANDGPMYIQRGSGDPGRVQPVTVTIPVGAPEFPDCDVRCSCGAKFTAPVQDGTYMCPDKCGGGICIETKVTQ